MKDRVTLAALVLFFAAILVLSAHAWVTINRIEADSAAISRNSEIILELYDRSEDRWRKSDHDRWAEELQKLNPALKVPK